MKREILDGQHFGEWEVLRYAGHKAQLCKCSCGEIREVSTNSLKSGKSKNCGNKLLHTKNKEQAAALLKYTLENVAKPKTKAIDMIGFTVNDLTVESKISEDRYLCRCICGAEKEVRGYSLRHPPSSTSYVCNHKNVVAQRFGKLTVIERLPNQICRCRCDCGNIKDIFIGNLLNGSTISCGCTKAPIYSKEQVIEILLDYIKTNNEKPFASELAEILGIGMTATYSYISNYELSPYINTYYGSKAEKEIATLLESKYDIKVHDRKILNGIELDIYIPEIKTAIEFNGNYWHSYPLKSKTYHQDKTLSCIEKGIRLIHIFEYEWKNPTYRPKIDSILTGLLNNNQVIYARKLEIKEIGLRQAKEFEEENHLQGSTNSEVNIALTQDNDIIGLMTFGKPRFDGGYSYELIRLCYKSGLNIVGGAERMFKYFITTYNPESIITYCSLAKFTGNVYKRLGFTPVENGSITEPNYVWVDPNSKQVLTRYKTMKKKLIAMGLGNETMTEDDIMTSYNYSKIYDSGNLKLEYKRGKGVNKSND